MPWQTLRWVDMMWKLLQRVRCLSGEQQRGWSFVWNPIRSRFQITIKQPNAAVEATISTSAPLCKLCHQSLVVFHTTLQLCCITIITSIIFNLMPSVRRSRPAQALQDWGLWHLKQPSFLFGLANRIKFSAFTDMINANAANNIMTQVLVWWRCHGATRIFIPMTIVKLLTPLKKGRRG